MIIPHEILPLPGSSHDASLQDSILSAILTEHDDKRQSCPDKDWSDALTEAAKAVVIQCLAINDSPAVEEWENEARYDSLLQSKLEYDSLCPNSSPIPVGAAGFRQEFEQVGTHASTPQNGSPLHPPPYSFVVHGTSPSSSNSAHPIAQGNASTNSSSALDIRPASYQTDLPTLIADAISVYGSMHHKLISVLAKGYEDPQYDPRGDLQESAISYQTMAGLLHQLFTEFHDVEGSSSGTTELG